jgi:hypothetical protein
MDDKEVIDKAFGPLFVSTVVVPQPLPLLAHYTSIKIMESIFQTGQIWFSNPLFMNDLQEVRFGLQEGQRLFLNHDLLISAVGTDERLGKVASHFQGYFGNFDMNEVFDIYLFCLSEHEASNMDGLLSMWRGYGHHGDGVALVFDPNKVTEVPTSPLIFQKVQYASDQDRLSQLTKIFSNWAQLTAAADLPDEKLWIAAYTAFYAVKQFSLTTKHVGFSEEAEWRVIYSPDRDPAGLLKQCLAYHIGERGVEPKLKFQVGHLPGVTHDDLALDRLLERIILGPSLSSPLARRSVQRMLDNIGRPEFKSRLFASGIPLRPNRGSAF